MRFIRNTRIFDHIPALLGGILGLLAPWMILGYWTRWLFFPEVQKYIILLIISVFSCTLFSKIFQLVWQKLNLDKLRFKKILLLLVVFGISLFTSYELRDEFPLALSNPFKIHELVITGVPNENSPGHTKDNLSFILSTAYGNPVYVPSLQTNGGWDSTGNRIFNITGNAKPLQFRFPENRINSRLSLQLFKSPDSGKALLKVADQTIPLDFFDNEESKSTVMIQISDNQKIPKFQLLVDLLLQSIYFSMLALFIITHFSTFYTWLAEKSAFILLFIIDFILRPSFLLFKNKHSFTWLAIIAVFFACFLINPLIPLFFLDCFLICLTSLLLTSLLDKLSIIAFFISFSLFSFANLVISVEILGCFGFLQMTGFFLLHLIFTLILLALWIRKGKPNLFGTLSSMDFSKLIVDIKRFFYSHKEIALLFIAVVLCQIISIILIIIVPQNIDDILTAYMARVGYWLQNKSLYPWNTSIYFLTQLVYPINGQVFMAWTGTILHSNILSGFSQVIFLPLGIISIYGISRFLKAERSTSLTASLLFAILPNVINQTSVALTDLIIACLVSSMLYCLFVGIKERNQSLLILSSLSFGLAFGTKQTIFFLVPGLMVLIFTLFLVYGRKSVSLIINFAIYSILAILVLGTLTYFTNLVVFGSLTGPNERVQYFTHIAKQLSLTDRLDLLALNSLRVAFHPLFDNLPFNFPKPLFSYIYQFLPEGSAIRDVIPRITYPRGYSWIGQSVYILLLVTFFSEFRNAIKKRDWLILGILAMTTVFMIILLSIKDYPLAFVGSLSRYIIIAVICLFPLIPKYLHNKSVVMAVISLSIITTIPAFMYDRLKPLTGDNTIWNKTQSELASMRFPELRPLLLEIENNVPENATLGIILVSKFPQSLLFTADFSRRIIQIAPVPNSINEADLKDKGINYILIEKEVLESGLSLPSGLEQISSSSADQILFAFP